MHERAAGCGAEPLSKVEKAKVLGQVPLFRDLAENYKMAIAQHGQDVHAEADEVLVREGATDRDFMLVLEDTVWVERGGKTTARLSRGNHFGEMSLLDGQPRSATVIADTPASCWSSTTWPSGSPWRASRA